MNIMQTTESNNLRIRGAPEKQGIGCRRGWSAGVGVAGGTGFPGFPLRVGRTGML